MNDDVTTDSLYERDFVEWSRQQADAVRAARDAIRAGGAARQDLPALLGGFDWDNIVEELETLGRSERRELGSHIATVIEHLIKLECSPAGLPRRGWRATILRARGRISLVIDDSPSLRREIPGLIGRVAAGATRAAILSMKSHGEMDLPHLAARAAAYTVEQIVDDWWPERDQAAGGSSTN